MDRGFRRPYKNGIAKILFIVFIILFVVALVMGRGKPRI